MTARIVKKISPASEYMMMEVGNAETILLFHLERCEDKEALKRVAEILAALSEAFLQKKIDLGSKTV